MDTSVGLGYIIQTVIAALIPLLIQALKNAKWWPFWSAWSSKATKIIVAILFALGNALGITYTFDPAVGDLVVHGLTLAGMGHALLAFVMALLAQQFSFLAFARKVIPTRR